MTIADLKGAMLARQANLAADLQKKQHAVILAEADLVIARQQAAAASGALQAVMTDLADVEKVLQAPVPAGSPPNKPSP